MAEINVTPLVDVMLVLLIIFMVAAPMMTQGIDVDLPQTTSKSLRQEEEPLLISVNSKGEIFLGKVKVTTALLRQQLGAMPPEARKRPIYLRADRQVPYGQVVAIMDDIKQAGFTRLGMVTQPATRKQ
ncbi:protein TolR [Desulfolithobacter sp.]